MKKWIPFSHVEGGAPRQAHVKIPEGCYEREVSKEGFFGPATHMLHSHPPTAWEAFQGDMLPRAFDLTKIKDLHQPSHPYEASVILHNAFFECRFWNTNKSMDALVRNSDGDQILFIHNGQGDLFCDYGQMSFSEGDYIMIPRGTMWRLEFEGKLDCLMIEAKNTHYYLPDKGILGDHAIFDPAILAKPSLNEEFEKQKSEEPWRVLVKKSDKISQIRYPFNPLDAVHWQGTLCPVKVNWRDIRPVMSDRYHIPPSVHTTFLSDRFVVCTFCPRPLESDPEALSVPFFHNNDDYDEILFYHQGDFFSRDNIHAGMMTYHPSGFTHGPHPKALKASLSAKKREVQQDKIKRTNEVAVMIDTRDPVIVGQFAEKTEWKGYVDSWSGYLKEE